MQSFKELLAAFRNNPMDLLEKIPGIFLVNKPKDITSHDMVAKARKILGLKYLGHAGTLDPLATGLLILLADKACRLFDELQLFPKIYQAEFTLGIRTDTQDITGKELEPWQASKTLPIDKEKIIEKMKDFKGNILQTPPMYSAIKKNGAPLYKLARKGVEVVREPRAVNVYDLELLEFDGIKGLLNMKVSKGFYVRTLIDDLGLALGTGAVMTALHRTEIGPFNLHNVSKL